MNNEGQVHFDDREPLPKKFEASYLGNETNREVSIKHEVLNKMQEVRRIWFKMAPYWKASSERKVGIDHIRCSDKIQTIVRT